MRMLHMGLTMAALTMGVGPAAMPPIVIERPAEAQRARPKRKLRVNYGSSGTGYRSRNAPPKRKLKANRLHISRRTKRKHRRAAR